MSGMPSAATARAILTCAAVAFTACVDLPRELPAGSAPTAPSFPPDAGADALDLPLGDTKVAGACAGRSPGIYCGALLDLDPSTRYACDGSADASTLGRCAATCVQSDPPGNDSCSADCSSGDASDPSCVAQTDPPTGVLAAPGNAFAVVRWSPSAQAQRTYTVVASPGGSAVTVPSAESVARIGGLANGTSYTFAVQADQGPPSSSSNAVTPAPDANVIADVPFYAQEHSDTCEAAALRMVLAHTGPTPPTEAALMTAIGTDPRPGSVDGGTLYWGDPYAIFVGDPDGNESKLTGYGTYYSTIARVATSFGASVLQAGEGISPSVLYDAIGHDHPVIAWLSGDLTYHARVMAWAAFDGKTLDWHGPIEHALVIVGVTSDAVLVDNLHGAEWQSIPRTTFEAAYGTFNQMAVIVD